MDMAAASAVSTFKQKCRVPECVQDHVHHFCQLCTAQNSNHLSSNCPRSRTLYHGTQVEYIAKVSLKKARDHGSLGKGIYFVENYNEARSISKHQRSKDPKGDPNSVVIKCKVDLGKHCDLGNSHNDTTWQNGDYDSASAICHPCGTIKTPFKEYCLKDSMKCRMITLYMNDEAIEKDANMSWGQAQQVINQLKPNATSDDFKKAVERIKILNLKAGRNVNDIDDGTSQEQQAMHNQNRPFRAAFASLVSRIPKMPKMPRKPNMPRRPKAFKHMGIELTSNGKWVLNRWYVFVKTFMTLFFICNSVWSAAHISNRQDGRSVVAFVFFIVFFCLQSIANIIYLGLHWKDCLNEPYEINIKLTLGKFMITLFLEMPMLVSQASNINRIISKDQQWDGFTWDIALQFQFVLNLVLCVTIDVLYQPSRGKFYKAIVWSVAAFFVSLLISLLICTPIHLTQLGWIWRPNLNDFGGNVTETNTKNILTISMYAGAAGLWIWPITFPLCILVPLWLQYELNYGASLKFYLVHFNILNGIWSIMHLYQLNLDESNEKVMLAFAVFFSLQAVLNVVLTISNFCLEFPCRKKESRSLISSKLIIAFVFEMPMLTCQAYAMRNMDNLVWSNLNWDVSMHLQFIINIILFVAVDIVSDNVENDWIALPLVIFPTIQIIYAPVYLALIGWSYAPKGVRYFGGIIGDDDNGIEGLLYILMIFGVVGLYIWTIVLSALALGIVISCIKLCCKK